MQRSKTDGIMKADIGFAPIDVGFTPKADIQQHGRDVRFGSKADMTL
jgi:hypothetical protein